MLKPLGIRTLIICGAVNFIAGKPLVVQAADDVSIINPTKILNITEGNKGTLFFEVLNNTGHTVNLGLPPLFDSPTQIGGPDSFDRARDVDVQAWATGTKLPTGKSSDIDVVISTVADSPPDITPDFGQWNIESHTFTIDGFNLMASGEFRVNDAPVVPEASSSVLVGTCALSVCGVGLLRRRRIRSEA